MMNRIPATLARRMPTAASSSSSIKRSFSSSAACLKGHGITRCAVIGAGQMGIGIAYVSARNAKVDVILTDSNESALHRGMEQVDKQIAKDLKTSRIKPKEAEDIKQRIKVVTSIGDLKADEPQLVMEAVSESLPLKQKIFSELAKTLPMTTILATNTSSISIAKIAASAVPSDPTREETKESTGRVVGIHWMNPVPVMPLCEIISSLQTTPEITARAKAFAEACKKEVTISADTPGFLANRILMPFINEAILCLETGVGSKEDLDKTALLGFRHPMGPLRLADLIGLDTCLAIMQTLHEETGDSKYRPSILLGRMVDAGFLGVKAGKGFYDYPKQ